MVSEVNRIRQHIPGYVSGVESALTPFDTLEGLLSIPWVSAWTKDHPQAPDKFHRFVIDNKDGNNRWTLMAEFNAGRNWWVVGFLDHKVELPIWDRERAASYDKNH